MACDYLNTTTSDYMLENFQYIIKRNVCVYQINLKVKNMGFGSFIGGIILGILAVLVAIFGFVILLGFVSFIPSSYNVILGMGILILVLSCSHMDGILINRQSQKTH
jgi:hypothetical protein